jgi:hypothetical protein
MLQIVALLTVNSRGVIYNCNILIIQATGLKPRKLFVQFITKSQTSDKNKVRYWFKLRFQKV